MDTSTFPARYLLNSDGTASGITMRYCSMACRGKDETEEPYSDETESAHELPTDDYQCDYCGALLLKDED